LTHEDDVLVWPRNENCGTYSPGLDTKSLEKRRISMMQSGGLRYLGSLNVLSSQNFSFGCL